MKKVSGMPGWTDIGSDVNWPDYGGKWAKLAKDGSVYVVEFTNMYDACGEDECKRDGQAQYVAEAKRVALRDLHPNDLRKACDCVGLRYSPQEIVNDTGDVVANRSDLLHMWPIVLAEACVSFGYYEPLETFQGNTHAARLRAQARRACESYMKDAAALEVARNRPVNKIGSTAAEYGRGDLDSALERGPFDVAKNVMRKMHGLPEIKE